MKKYRSVFRNDLLAAQSIIVTGGGSGIGRCIAHELASLGATVLLVGRQKGKLQTVQKEIEHDGGRASSAVCDIRNELDIEEMVSKMAAAGPIHGLVNCAGGQFPALLAETSVNGFSAVVTNNLAGTFAMSKSVYLHSMKSAGGAIVNITADVTGGMPLMGHSSAARAGVENLTMTAALEWAADGVRVNAVAPGYVASSGFDTYTDERMLRAIKAFPERTPLGRHGTEAEISAAVCFLLSPAGYFVTGQIWRIDGGFGLKTNTPMLEWRAPKRNPQFDGFHRSERPKLLGA
jgi:citronellol/citronellal dehydrogenase